MNDEKESKQSDGGKARAESLSADERKLIAKKAAEARWGKRREVEESVWDEKKYPDREVWDIAVSRAWRAREYARKQPDKIGGGEERFQDIGWQYRQVKGRKAEGFVPEWVSDDPHPVYPWLRKVAGREYDEHGLVLRGAKA